MVEPPERSQTPVPAHGSKRLTTEITEFPCDIFEAYSKNNQSLAVMLVLRPK